MRKIQPYSIKHKTDINREIEEQVNDCLNLIEMDLDKAISQHERRSVTKLINMNFQIPGLTKEGAQRRIFYHVLKALEEAKYIPKLKISENDEDYTVTFIIEWITNEDRDTEKFMDTFIAERML